MGYKVLAALLLDRLIRGGADDRIQNSQFGFRQNKGTRDALFLTRRMIEATLDDKDGSLYIVLLDWSKAFDRIAHEPLLAALRRFGVPPPMLSMISGIYRQRSFSVRDGGQTSTRHEQAVGIAQGCPLSPYLFVMMMTVLLHDAGQGLERNHVPPYIVTPEVVYADDTMLLGSDPVAIQVLLDRVAAAGVEYGLHLNVSKTVLLRIRGSVDICGPDGSALSVKDEAVYLGALLSVDGRPVGELTRRLGEARQTLDKLSAVWRHANLTRDRKKMFFEAFVVSKLLYGLETTWLLKAERVRLDGFYARCLRKLLGVAPAFVSRVSNKIVLHRFGAQPLSLQLLGRQLLYYGRLAGQTNTSLPRNVALEASDVTPRFWNMRRCVGRPRLRWTCCVFAFAVQVAGGSVDELRQLLLQSPQQTEWRERVAICS